MHTQCCSLCYSQARLWSPECALKAAEHLVRAFSSVSAHSKAFLSYTDDDSEVSANREGRMSSQTSWTDAKARGKKLEKKPLSEILFSEVKEDFCSLWSGSQKIGLMEKPPRKRFFHSSPASICLCTVEFSWVHRHEDTNFIHTQSNKQGFFLQNYPFVILQETLLSIQVSWTGQLTVQSSSCHRIQSPWATTCSQQHGKHRYRPCMRMNCSPSSGIAVPSARSSFTPMISF